MGSLVKTPHSEVTATLEVLGNLGVMSEHLARLRAESDYAKRVAEIILQGGLAGSIHQELARRVIPGKNFFGVEGWSSLYGMNFSKKQLREVAEFPWSEDFLNSSCPFHKEKSVKETHFAFLGLDTFKGKPLNIMKWHQLHPPTGQPRFRCEPNPWYKEEKFANEATCEFRWHLMLMEIVPNSENKPYREQLGMLPPEYEPPSAVEEVTKNILYYRKNGVYLNPTRYGRCQDVTSGGDRVYVGYFDSGGLSVYYCWGDYRGYFIGLAASRKF